MAGSMTRTAAHSAPLLLLLAALSPSLSRADGSSGLPSVSVVATVPTVAVDGSSNGILTFTRTGNTSSALTVNFGLSGTAAKWTDYYRLPAGASSATLAITGKTNSTGANPETAIFTVESDSSYSAGSPATATLTIVLA